MRMKKFLLLIAAVMTAGVGMAQKVTLDFTNGVEEWGLPKESANGVTEGTYSNGTYSISVSTTTGKAYYLTQNKCLLIGKKDATVTLPAFDFNVGKIVVTGNSGAGGKVTFNIFVGEEAVSTEVTSAKVAQTFEIAEANQAAGTVYTIKVTNAKNTQINTIDIYEVGSEVVDPEPEPDPEPVEATVAEALAAAANSLLTVKGQAVAITAGGAVIADTTDYIYYYGTPDFKLGDTVTVTGKVSAYSGFNQFSAQTEGTTIVAGKNAEVAYPEAVAMDGAAMDAWAAAPAHQYVTVTGTLTISQGKYYNIVVEGAEKAQAAIISPTDEMKEAMTNGDNITITGYAMYTTSSGKYVNIAVANYKVNTQVELEDPTNTVETAYTVAKTRELIDNRETVNINKEVYVKGIITEVKEVSLQYKNATYVIADEAGSETTLTVLRGKWFNGEAFTREDAIKVGDEVIVLGSLALYNDTDYQMNTGNKIISLNGELTDGINGISAAQGEGKAYDLTGRIANKNAKGIVIVNGKKVVK